MRSRQQVVTPSRALFVGLQDGKAERVTACEDIHEKKYARVMTKSVS